MQYYAQDDNNKKGKVWAAAMTLLGYLLCIVLMLLIKFNLGHTPVTEGEGIMINFGDVAEAGGEHDTPMTDDTAPTPSQPQANPTPSVPATSGDVEVPQPTQRPATQQQPTEPVRTADPRALFPGRTTGSTSTSEGTGAGPGNQGNPAGTPEGSHDGTGTGTSGTAFNLSGRSLVGALPSPAYAGNRQGKVVITVVVNSAGQVVSAVYSATGSTLNETSLVDEARRAALKARFNNIEGDGLQTGTITYIFRMN